MSPNAGGGGASANEYSCTYGAQINFGDLTYALGRKYRTQQSVLPSLAGGEWSVASVICSVMDCRRYYLVWQWLLCWELLAIPAAAPVGNCCASNRLHWNSTRQVGLLLKLTHAFYLMQTISISRACIPSGNSLFWYRVYIVQYSIVYV